MKSLRHIFEHNIYKLYKLLPCTAAKYQNYPFDWRKMLVSLWKYSSITWKHELYKIVTLHCSRISKSSISMRIVLGLIVEILLLILQNWFAAQQPNLKIPTLIDETSQSDYCNIPFYKPKIYLCIQIHEFYKLLPCKSLQNENSRAIWNKKMVSLIGDIFLWS